MPPRPKLASATLAGLGLPESGPILVTLTLDDSDPASFPAASIAWFADELERLAPGRVSLVVLAPGCTVAALDDEELRLVGLTRPDPRKDHLP